MRAKSYRCFEVLIRPNPYRYANCETGGLSGDCWMFHYSGCSGMYSGSLFDIFGTYSISYRKNSFKMEMQWVLHKPKPNLQMNFFYDVPIIHFWVCSIHTFTTVHYMFVHFDVNSIFNMVANLQSWTWLSAVFNEKVGSKQRYSIVLMN